MARRSQCSRCVSPLCLGTVTLQELFGEPDWETERQCPAACISSIAEARDSTQPPWLMKVTFCVTGLGILGPETATSAVAEAGAEPGWMFDTLNASGRSPFLAAFLNS